MSLCNYLCNSLCKQFNQQGGDPTGTGKGGFLDRIAASDMTNAQRIDSLYAAALARKPTRKEIKLANQMMVARKGDAISALQDIWWAVLNSNEFIINH